MAIRNVSSVESTPYIWGVLWKYGSPTTDSGLNAWSGSYEYQFVLSAKREEV